MGRAPPTAGKLGATSECEGPQPRLGGRSPPCRQTDKRVGRRASGSDVALSPTPNSLEYYQAHLLQILKHTEFKPCEPRRGQGVMRG